MPDYGDIEGGLPPVTFDPAPDLSSLAWPWDQPALPPIGVAAAPPIPDAVTPQGEIVPAGALPGQPGEPQPVPLPDAAIAAPAGPPPAMQPGLGIPRAALDPLIPPAPVSPIPAGPPAIAPPAPSPDLGAAPPVVAAPAVAQPLTPTAGASALGEPLGVPPPLTDLAGFAPAPLGEPGLPPAPSPFAPHVADLPDITIHTERPGEVAPDLADAISGGMLPGGVTLTPEQRYAAVAGGYQRDPNKLLDRLEQPGALDPETQRYLDEFAARDPAGAAVVRQRLIDKGTALAASERARVAKDTYDKQMANIERLKAARAVAAKKSAAIDEEATKIAETKIGYHPSTLQRIAGIIAAVVGGLYQGRTGSARNPGLDALNDIINRDLEEQKLSLANRRDVLTQRRSALGELTARNNDDYQTDETMRLAALKYADEQLAQAQMNFAPDGTRGLNLAMLRTGLNAQIAASKEARDGKLFDRAVKLQDAARQQQIADETARNNRATTGLGYARIFEDQQQRKEAREARAADKATERTDKDAERDRQFALGGTPHLAIGPDGKPLLTPDGKPQISYDDLRNADGSRWHASSPEEHKALWEKKTATTQLTKLYNRVLAIRDRVGGESKVWNSDDYQELKGIEKEILLLKKSGTQGMSSDADMENLSGAAGAEDITSFRSKAGGLRAARARTVDKLNQEFRDARYTGPELVFPEPQPARNTAAEEATQHLLQKPTESVDDVVAGKLADLHATRGYAIDLNNPADRDIYQQAVREARESHNPDASIAQRAQITDLGARASRGDADARQALETVAREGHTGALRALAQNQVDSSGRAQIATLTERAAGDGDAAVAARRDLQRLTREAPSAALRTLAQDQLNAIGRAKSAAASAPPAPVDVPPELRLGGQ